MPVESSWQRKRCIFDVQDASMAIACGSAGRMEQERAHQQSVPSRGDAKKVRVLTAKCLNLFGRKSAQAMRSGQDAQCTIRLVGVVEVKPDSEHLLEEFDWRLDVRNTILRAPRPKPRMLGANAKRQRQILMPRNQPVRARAHFSR
jgi:hypothetical protein